MYATVPSTRYKPQKLIVKMTHFPEVLSDHPELAQVFKSLIEDVATEISDTRMTTTLETYSVPEVSRGGVDTSIYATPNAERKDIYITLPELKDKFVTRTLKKLCDIVFKDKAVNENPVQNVGFDLLMYEVSEDGTEVIDAWKLIDFVIPYGLGITRGYSKTNPTDSITADTVYSVAISGKFLSCNEVIDEAAALHHEWLARQPFKEPVHVSSFTL